MDPNDVNAIRSQANKVLMRTGVSFSPCIIMKSEGTRLYGLDGIEMLDFSSGQMSLLLGHSHPEIVEVVGRYAGELCHLASNMITYPVVDLATRLGRILPLPLEKSFFLSTGSESTEAAIQMAKCYTRRFEIVAFSASFHGLASSVGSAIHSAGRRDGGSAMHRQLVFPAPYAYRSSFKTAKGDYDWEAEMKNGWSMIDRQSVGSLAAFIIEPILSAGGILEPPKGYLKRLSIECKKRDMLLIVDEAQTGVGRTGQMFAFERDEIIPDILTLSKTLGCGYALASVSTTAEIARGCDEADFQWHTTHFNDPLPAAVGSKVLEIVERENICQQAAKLGEQLRAELLQLQKKYWCIGDVRGRGLLQGIEIISDAESRDPGVDLGQAVSDRAFSRGLVCNFINPPGMGGVFRLAPPVTISSEEIEEGLKILDEAFSYVLETREAMVTSLSN